MSCTFSVTPCSPQGATNVDSTSTPYRLISQESGETYMGARRFVIHQGEIDALIRALQSARS